MALKDEDRELCKAVAKAPPDKVAACIRAGADPGAVDGDGWTLPCLAAVRGDAASLELLLAAGADVDAAVEEA